MSKKAMCLGVATIIVVTCAAGAWFYMGYYGAGKITLPDGTVVRDFSVAEAGEFAHSRHEPVRRRHLERRQSLREAETVAIDASSIAAVAGAIGPILDDAIEANPEASRALARAGPAARQELTMLLARVVAVMAGLERDEYVAALPAGLTLGRPAAFAAVELSASKFADFAIPDEGAPPSAWEEAFAQVYDSTRGYRGGEFLLRGIISDPDHLIVAVAPHEHDRPATIVEAQYGTEVFNRVVRTSTQALPVFYQATPHDTPGGRSREHHHTRVSPSLLDATIVFFAEDGSGDRYPVSMTATYDASRPAGARWTLMFVARLSSPRVFVAPFFAF